MPAGPLRPRVPRPARPRQDGVRQDLRGSAVCTASTSVMAFEELAFDDETLSLSQIDRNDCPLDAKQGYADMAGVLLLFLLLLLLGKAQEKAAEFADTQVGAVEGRRAGGAGNGLLIRMAGFACWRVGVSACWRTRVAIFGCRTSYHPVKFFG